MQLTKWRSGRPPPSTADVGVGARRTATFGPRLGWSTRVPSVGGGGAAGGSPLPRVRPGRPSPPDAAAARRGRRRRGRRGGAATLVLPAAAGETHPALGLGVLRLLPAGCPVPAAPTALAKLPPTCVLLPAVRAAVPHLWRRRRLAALLQGTAASRAPSRSGGLLLERLARAPMAWAAVGRRGPLLREPPVTLPAVLQRTPPPRATRPWARAPAVSTPARLAPR